MDRISYFFFIPRNEQGYESIYKRIRLMPLYSFPHYKELKPHLKNLIPKFFLHTEFDAFYAQVEQRDNPNLRGKPVSVGRRVIGTCSCLDFLHDRGINSG